MPNVIGRLYIGFFGGGSKENSLPVKSNGFVFQLGKAVKIYLLENMVCTENSRDFQLFKKVYSDCHIQTSSWRVCSASEWDETVDVMLRNMEARGVKFNEKEIQKIRAYLKRNDSSD